MTDRCEHNTFRNICGICHRDRDNVITALRAENTRLYAEVTPAKWAAAPHPPPSC